MKNKPNILFASVLLLLLLINAANAEEQVYYAAEHQSWYHAKQGCDFGGAALSSSFAEPVFFEMTKEEAEIAYLRPCPACAREWRAAFSGEFPTWEHDVEPWSLGGSFDTYLPVDVRSAWGDFSNAMYELYGFGPFPDDYAKHYRNASGGVTVMLVNPSLDRMESIREHLGADFWVLEADFDWNYLTELQNMLSDMMGEKFGIHSVGANVEGNCLNVGVDNDESEIIEAIYNAIKEKGYDRRAVVIQKEERAQWM